MLEAFYDRLRDVRKANSEGSGDEWEFGRKIEAQQTASVAGEFGILKHSEFTFEQALHQIREPFVGSEHVADYQSESGLVVKLTIPPKFGLRPSVVKLKNANLRNDPTIPDFRRAVEFVPGTPLGYLRRWIAANDIFHDDVQLASVVKWADGEVSFCITQPHYDGEPASAAVIDRYFVESGWTRIKDPNGEHEFFFNYAFNVLAVDAMPRNCYFNERDGLLPFDVILIEPDDTMDEFLKIFP